LVGGEALDAEKILPETDASVNGVIFVTRAKVVAKEAGDDGTKKVVKNQVLTIIFINSKIMKIIFTI
jgi:hypothetical protein